MIPCQIASLFIDRTETVAARINQTAQRLNFTTADLAFYAAHLVVDSDWLQFYCEPWAPQHILHQQTYGAELFGNTSTDDQERFRARGYGRVVGRHNYDRYSEWSGTDCISNPELLELPDHAYRSWEWLWQRRSGTGCARIALKDFGHATLLFVGWQDRTSLRLRTYNRNLGHIKNGSITTI